MQALSSQTRSREDEISRTQCPRELRAAKWACGRWIQRTCPKANTDDKMAECFVENRSKAPRRCQQAAAAVFKCEHVRDNEEKCMKKHVGKDTEKACKRDIFAHCRRAMRSNSFRNIFECMERNESRFSPVCIAETRNLVNCVTCGDARATTYEKCMEAYVRVCSDAKNGEEWKCYKDNKSEFPRSCHAAVSRMNGQCAAEFTAQKDRDDARESIERMIEPAAKLTRRQVAIARKMVEEAREHRMQREGEEVREERKERRS